MIRSESKTLTGFVWRESRVYISAALILCLLWLPQMLMTTLFINLKSVTVHSAIQGSPIYMDVKRDMGLIDFRGTFTVTIRKPDDAYVCSVGPAAPFNYRKTATLQAPMTMQWWLDGPENLQRCKDRGFTLGPFHAETCHIVLTPIFDIPIARRCVDSNIFQIYPEQITEQQLSEPYSQTYGRRSD